MFSSLLFWQVLAGLTGVLLLSICAVFKLLGHTWLEKVCDASLLLCLTFAFAIVVTLSLRSFRL